MKPAAYLGEFEHLVLLAVMHLDDQAYGVPIKRLIEERAERSVSFGAVYSTIRRLTSKGYVTTREEPVTGPEGGRPRRLVQITRVGRQAVDASQRRLARMATLAPSR